MSSLMPGNRHVLTARNVAAPIGLSEQKSPGLRSHRGCTVRAISMRLKQTGAGQTVWRAIYCGGISILGCLLNAGVAHAHARGGARELQHERPTARSMPRVMVATASWYGWRFAGRRTATGERFDPRQLTAASRQLPLGSHAIVMNLENGRSVRVRINDCGPYFEYRKVDLSKRAAERLAMVRKGVVPVHIRLIEVPRHAVYCRRRSATTRRKARQLAR
jgi:rare lipoprotein A